MFFQIFATYISPLFFLSFSLSPSRLLFPFFLRRTTCARRRPNPHERIFLLSNDVETYLRIAREITVARYVNKCFLSLTEERIGVCIFHVDFIACLWHYSALISQKMRLLRSLGCSRVEGRIRSIPRMTFSPFTETDLRPV